MKNTIKHCRLMIGAFIFAILFFMGGCADMNQLAGKLDQAINNKRDFFLDHMEEKYGVKFLPISYSGSGVVTNEEFRCYAEGTDPERDYVSVFVREEDGKEIIVDDYFGILIRDEYQNRVEAISDAVMGDSKAFVYRYSVSFFSNDLTSESTIDDAISMGERINATKYVFVEAAADSKEDFEARCDEIAAELKNAGLPGTVLFLGLAEGTLSQLTQENYMDYLPSGDNGSACLMRVERLVSVA